MLTIENFKRVCRLCLSQSANLTNIYHKDIIEKLNECTSLKAHRNDGLPKLVCSACVSRLSSSYAFRKLCESSDIELRRFLWEIDEERNSTTEDYANLNEAEKENGASPLDGDFVPENFMVEDENAEGEQTSTQKGDIADVIREEHSRSRKRLKPTRKSAFCIYCKNTTDNFSKHLRLFHKEEKVVRVLHQYPINSRERLNILSDLRQQGNFYISDHTARTPALSQQQQPKKDQSVDYVPCTYCMGYYSENELKKHSAFCKRRNKKNVRAIQHEAKLSPSKILAKHILPLMKNDLVFDEIKSDPLILMYASQLCARSDIKSKYIKVTVRIRIRQIARLLLAMKEANEHIKQLMDIFDLQYFDDLKAALHDIADFNAETQSYTKETLSCNLASSIKVCGNIIMTNADIQGNDVLKANVEKYLKFFDTNFAKHIRRIVKKKEKYVDADGIQKDDLDKDVDMSAADADVDTSAGEAEHIENVDDETTLSESNASKLENNTGEFETSVVEGSPTEKKRKIIEETDTSLTPSLLPPSVEDYVEQDGLENNDTEEKGIEKRVEKRRRRDREKRVLRRWSVLEKSAVRKYFSDTIDSGHLPSTEDVLKCISAEPCLKERTYQQIKSWISNQRRTLRN